MGMKPFSKAGSPDSYTEEMGQRICEAIGNTSKGYVHVRAANPDFPTLLTLYKWRARYPEFDKNLAIAEMSKAHILVEDAGAIADDGTNDFYTNSKGEEVFDSEHVQRSKLRLEYRKWYASKLSKKFGDKMSQEITGGNGGAIEVKSEHAMLHEVIETIIGKSVKANSEGED